MKTKNRISMATVLTLCLLISGFVTGQSYQFKPEWKEGETKTLIKHQVFKKFEQGELVKEDEQTMENPQVIKVLQSNPDYLEVVMNTDMAEFEESFGILERMNPEVNFPREIQVNYKINKETAEFEVLNLSELLSNYQKNFDILKNQIDQISDEAPTLIKISVSTFDFLISVLSSEAVLEAHLIEKIEPLIIPFQTTYQPGEVKITEEEIDNPLVPKQKIRCTVSTTFDSSKEDQHLFEYTNNYNIDQEELKQAFINMMKTMMESFGADEETVEKQIEPLRETEISYHIQQNILFDSQSNWVKTIITTFRYNMDDPKTNIHDETVMTETITVQ